MHKCYLMEHGFARVRRIKTGFYALLLANPYAADVLSQTEQRMPPQPSHIG